MRKLNLETELQAIITFLKDELHENGFDKLIIGLSGGIDSAVSAALAVQAVGKENVYGVMLPYKNSHPDSLNDAKLVAESLDIKYEVIEISKMVDAYFDNFAQDADSLRRGNRMARERMCVLYDLSAKYKALVVGTGNKSELLIGYCTQYGDSACAFEPIGHLYKTEVKEIAKLLDIPEKVIYKNPTADLWEGQTDEEELGISYEKLDKLLFFMIDQKLDNQSLIEKGFSQDEIDKVTKMYKNSSFKRKMPSSMEALWD